MPRPSARTGPFAPAAPKPEIWPAPLEPFNSLTNLAAICLADASPPPAPDHRHGRGSVASKKPVGTGGLLDVGSDHRIPLLGDDFLAGALLLEGREHRRLVGRRRRELVQQFL